MYIACQNGHSEIVDRLIAAGAGLNAKENVSHCTIRQTCILFCKFEFAEIGACSGKNIVFFTSNTQMKSTIDEIYNCHL